MSKEAFDGNRFTIKLTTIDDIVNFIQAFKHLDPVLYKIDIARAFHNLRVDPVDVKLGISWKGYFYLDLSIAFSWTHSSAAFQKRALHACIDDYMGIVPAGIATDQFCRLSHLLDRLGLLMNQDKHTPPTKALTCLGIHIDINQATLSIDHTKVEEIYQECLHFIKFLARKNFALCWVD